MANQIINLNGSVPAIPAGKAGVIFQSDYGTPTANTSAYVDLTTAGAAGLTTQIQINLAGAFYADSGFTYDPATHIVTLFNPIAATNVTPQNSPSLDFSHSWWNGAVAVNDTWTIVATHSTAIGSDEPALSISDNIGSGQSVILIPKNLWIGTSLNMAVSAPINWVGCGNISMATATSGQLLLHNSNSSGDTSFIFGTNTNPLSTFGGIFSRNGSTTLHARLGDDSADADFTAANIMASGFLTLGPAAVIQNTVKTNITSAQLKALPGTTVTLIPAPGANKLVIVRSATFQYRFVTTAYTIANADNTPQLVYTGQTDTFKLVMAATGLLDQTVNKVMWQNSASLATAATQTNAVNKGVDLTLTGTTPALTLGDGTLEIVLEYSIIDVS